MPSHHNQVPPRLKSHHIDPSKLKPAGTKAVENEQVVYQKGLKYERPTLTFQSTEWEAQACARLSSEAKGYVYGSAGTRETHNKNLDAFKRYSIVPRRLIKTEGFADLSTEIFGEKIAVPIALAPVGVQRIFNPDGEEAAARAAGQCGVPYILSTASSTSIEDVAKANDAGAQAAAKAEEANGTDEVSGQRWYQLYWPSREHDDITISMLKRAKDNGYTTLFVTVDTFILGWRPSDMDNGYNPFLRADQTGVAIGLSDPVFRSHFKKQHGKELEEDMSAAVAEWTKTIFPGQSHGWEDIKFLQDHWDGPIVVKGIQTIFDARKAVEVGVQGIVVSNHGGRQQDGGCSSLGMLPHIVDAVGDKLTIFFDSGVRCGADIVKALALGANCVLIGRPYIYGLTLGGEEGTKHVIDSLIGELELTLHLGGITSINKDQLNRSILAREDDLFSNVKGIVALK